jgi:hypothetical protein
MIIRLTARHLATAKPQYSISDGNHMVLAVEMSTRDMVDSLKAIAAVMPGGTWQKAIEEINQEEVTI